MMKNKKWIIVAAVAVVVCGWFWMRSKSQQTGKVVIEEVKPSRGTIEVTITTTGTVEPQNRLELKPSINGRIEEILVKEGDKVKKGQIIAWLSSTERAALLDAARSKGEETAAYWEEVYKPTPLIAPIDGNVIVRALEPGQSVTSSDPVLVLSDRLIVNAQVDETDIGQIEIGQAASISLDAYPRERVNARVDHISYESTLINNVTIYEVEILPEEVPPIFRAGMTANVRIVQKSVEDALRIPLDAVQREGGESFVLTKEPRSRKPVRRAIETGISDDEYIEVLDGITENETVVIEKMSRALPQRRTSGSPFIPNRQRNRSR